MARTTGSTALADLSRLASAIAELAALLDESKTPYMIIGGIAVLVWGEPRTTQDIDVTIRVPEERLDALVEMLATRLTLLPEDPVAFFRERRVLPVVTAAGVGVDLIWAGLPYEEHAIQRAVIRELEGIPVRVCTAEDLIVHKLASTRPRDWEDVVGIVARQGATLDRSYLDPLALSLSEVLEDPDIWTRYRRLIDG